ncbi:MAG: MazG nucleotide pyrophosphohydrolase domain-containing protein [Candidatus Aenigmatarchaeota archaeon]
MKEFDSFIRTIRKLRSPKGCPWDRAQKINDYKNYLLEETYELIEEINKNKIENIKEELGDLFLILVVITEIFRERAKFNLKDVLKSITKKIILRHPHVFSKKISLKTRDEVFNYWIRTKAKRKLRKNIKERLPLTAPSLLLADIFFREQKHLQNNLLEKEITSKILKEITDKLSDFSKKRKKDYILDPLFLICKLAFLNKINLENSLKKRILKEAEKIRY